MSFESGSLSFRIYSLSRPLPEDYIERFAKHSAPSIETSVAGGVSGWVTGRHLLDSDIREETAHYAGYLRLALLEIEKKIPPSLLKAECQIEELAMLAADGKQFLNQKDRAEIRESVTDNLLPQMPPQLKSIPLVYQPGGVTLYASALSVTKNDLLCARFLNSMGYNMTPCAPDRLVELHKKPDVRGWHPTSFSPKVGDESMMEVYPGREFLTWLLFSFDARGGIVEVDGVGSVSLLIEGPLTFYHEGGSVYETILKSGEPVRSSEASTCLMNGKLLRKATVTIAIKEEPWQFGIDGDEFVFRNVKLPETEKGLDSVSRFQDRIGRIDQLRDIFLGLYDRFITIRCTPSSWAKEKREMRNWVASRAG